jgi:hypothetical protein
MRTIPFSHSNCNAPVHAVMRRRKQTLSGTEGQEEVNGEKILRRGLM